MKERRMLHVTFKPHAVETTARVTLPPKDSERVHIVTPIEVRAEGKVDRDGKVLAYQDWRVYFEANA